MITKLKKLDDISHSNNCRIQIQNVISTLPVNLLPVNLMPMLDRLTFHQIWLRELCFLRLTKPEGQRGLFTVIKW